MESGCIFPVTMLVELVFYVTWEGTTDIWVANLVKDVAMAVLVFYTTETVRTSITQIDIAREVQPMKL